MEVRSRSWDELQAQYRALAERYHRFSSLAERMVGLLAVLRDDARVAAFDRWLSHYALILHHDGRYAHVIWSEPEGWAWAGALGYSVARVEYHEEPRSWQHIVVPEQDVIAAVLERLSPE